MLNEDHRVAPGLYLRARTSEPEPLAAPVQPFTSTAWVEVVNETGGKIELVGFGYRTDDGWQTMPVEEAMDRYDFVDVEFDGDGVRVWALRLTWRAGGEEHSEEIELGRWIVWASVMLYGAGDFSHGLIAFHGEE